MSLQKANQHTADINNAATLAIADTVDLLTIVKDLSVPEIAAELRLTLPTIADTYATVSGQLAVAYYAESRLEAQLADDFVPEMVKPDIDTEINRAIGYTAAQATKGATFETITATLAGHIQRMVAGTDRETLTSNIWSLKSDPRGGLGAVVE